MRPSAWAIVVLIIVVILLFGASRLPDLAGSIGKSLKIFKREVKELQDDDQTTGSSYTATGGQPPQTTYPPYPGNQTGQTAYPPYPGTQAGVGQAPPPQDLPNVQAPPQAGPDSAPQPPRQP
ncbi:Sec-independent protein translocase subunit TatA [Georgenia sp. AZ-5]|uniref:Sec-independent protein translocase subunit TatA n=1 Tax=Georgenia sp. AZ-5 TaxID=3367526 RepID=UPI0037541809